MQLFICSVSLVFWLSTPFYILIILLRILILDVQPQLFIRFLPARPKVEWKNFNHILAWGLTVRGNVQAMWASLLFFSSVPNLKLFFCDPSNDLMVSEYRASGIFMFPSSHLRNGLCLLLCSACLSEVLRLFGALGHVYFKKLFSAEFWPPPHSNLGTIT